MKTHKCNAEQQQSNFGTLKFHGNDKTKHVVRSIEFSTGVESAYLRLFIVKLN